MREKEKLLDLLEEKEIRDKIIEIVQAEEKCDDRQVLPDRTFKHVYSETELQNKIVSAREEYARGVAQKQQDLVNEYNSKILRLSKELEEAKKQISDAGAEIESMKEKYSVSEYLYEIYCQFDSQQMRWFDKVLHGENQKAESPLALVVWATQKENLMSMWEIISLHINELERTETAKRFSTFFEICFNLYAATTRGKAVLNKTSVGISYEPLKHSKTVDSRAAGLIEEVVLPGYTIGNETRKSIVKVK